MLLANSASSDLCHQLTAPFPSQYLRFSAASPPACRTPRNHGVCKTPAPGSGRCPARRVALRFRGPAPPRGQEAMATALAAEIFADEWSRTSPSASRRSGRPRQRSVRGAAQTDPLSRRWPAGCCTRGCRLDDHHMAPASPSPGRCSFFAHWFAPVISSRDTETMTIAPYARVPVRLARALVDSAVLTYGQRACALSRGHNAVAACLHVRTRSAGAAPLAPSCDSGSASLSWHREASYLGSSCYCTNSRLHPVWSASLPGTSM